MARIPIIQERQAVGQMMAVPELRAPDTGAVLIGASMQQLGRSIGQVATTANFIAEENGKAYALQASGQAKQEMTEYFLKAQETASPGAAGFTRNFDTEFQNYANKLLENAPEGAPRRFLGVSLENLRNSFQSQALSFEVSEGRAYRFDQTSQGITQTANALYRNPSQSEYEKSRGEMLAMVDSMSLTPEQRRRLTDQINTALPDAVVAGQININPDAFLDNVASATGSNVDRDKLQNAQIFVESANKPDAISPKGATGLMQVMPMTAMKPGYGLPNIFEFAESKGLVPTEFETTTDETGKVTVNVKAREFDYTVEEAKRLLKKPEIGAEYGKLYMDAMMRQYDNNLVHALVAYNWGPGNANKWIARGANFADLPEETRNYVPKVLSKAGINIKLDGSPQSTGNPAFDNLPYEKQMQYVNMATTRSKQLQAERRVLVERTISDQNAMAMDGIVAQNPLTMNDFVSAYGAENGLRNYQVYQDNQVMASDIGMLKTLPLDEMQTKVQAYEPEPGEGYELAAKRYDIVRQSAARVIQMRNEDPVRYTLDTNPDVAKAYEAYKNIGLDSTATQQTISAAAQDYVSKSQAEQQRLGIVDPKILSKVEMDQLARRIGAGNEDAANLVVSIEQTYGANYYPQVMDELLAAGKLSNAMIVIADLPDPSSRELVARLANIDMANLKAGMSSIDLKDITTETTAVVQELRATAGPITDQSAKTLAAYQDIIERSAIEFLASGQANNASTAVEMAAQRLLGHYQFDGTLRMPANMDGDYIQDGLERSLQGVYDSLTIADVPSDLTMAYTPEEALDLWKSTIDNSHFWLADNDTKGAFLWVRGDNGVAYKVLRGGKEVYMRYDQVIAQELEVEAVSQEDLMQQMTVAP